MRKTGRLLIALTVTAALFLAFPAQAKQKPPKPEKMKKLTFPSFKEFKTKNNIDAIVVEQHEQPIVTIEVVLKTGSSLDPAGKSALADFTVSLLNKGTKDKNSDELAKWIESVGGSVGLSSRSDWSTVSVTILSDYIDTAYEYLKDILENPTFPENELELYRKRTKTGLELEKSQPAAVARRHFAEIVYGKHPYAKDPTVETVEAISRDDVVDFFGKNFVANNALIAVVGDVKVKEVKKSIDKYFGSWKQGTPETVTYTAPPEIAHNQIYLYNKPGAVQTTIMVGHAGLKPTNQDWPKVTVANRILGGGADARLFMDLREKRGWTYGAYSRFSRPMDIGTFRANTDVRTEVTDSALVELMSQLKKIAEEPVTPEELEHAKDYLVGNFPITIETPNQIANQVVWAKLLGLGKEYLEKYRERISAVTIANVGSAMKEYLHPDNAAIVLVGDAAAIHDKVAKVANVELFDLDGEKISLAELTVKPVSYDYNTSVFKDMEATYTVSMQQMNLGDLKMSMKKIKSGDTDVIQVSNSLSGMMSLDQMLEFRADDMTPVMCKSTIMAGPNQMTSDLKFEEGKVTGSIKGMEASEATEVSKELVDGTILDDQLEFALAALPLKASEKYRFPILESDSGNMSTVNAEVVEEDEVTVPAGKFATFKIKVKRPDSEAYLYVMKDSPHLVVKHEIPAQGLKIELKQLSK